jgi:hypothetical protein
VSALGYEYTWNADEASKDPNKILVSYDERGNITPKITDAQKKEAEQALRDRFRTMLDREVRKTYIPPPASTTSASTATKKTAEQLKAEIDQRKGDVTNQYRNYLQSGVLYPELIDRAPAQSAQQLMSKVGEFGFMVQEEGDGVVVYRPELGVDGGIRLKTGGKGGLFGGGYIKYGPDGKPIQEQENMAKYNELKANIDALIEHIATITPESKKIDVLGLPKDYISGSQTSATQGASGGKPKVDYSNL